MARQGKMSFKIILFGRIITTVTDFSKKSKLISNSTSLQQTMALEKKQWQAAGNGKCELEAM